MHRLALLGSLCLFLSAVEYLIPKPLPFMRIGLANLPLLLALDFLSPARFFFLALIKVLGQGIIGGTLFSYVFLFSLAGTFSSALLMFGLRGLLGKKLLGFIGLGCAGAMASNAVQLLLARFFIFGAALRYLMPPFLASGFITGIALGIVCEIFCRRSRWYMSCIGYCGTDFIKEAGHSDAPSNENSAPLRDENTKKPEKINFHKKCKQRWDNLFNADELFVAGLLMSLLFLFNRSIEIKIIHFAFFCVLAVCSGKKINVFMTLLAMSGIVFFNLLVPYGKVIAVFGPLRLTQGSLLSGIEKALTLTGLLMLSRACIASDLKLPGKAGSVLGESLRLLELMRERKSNIRRGNIIAGIDHMLLDLESDCTAAIEPEARPKRSFKSILLLILIIILTLLPIVVNIRNA